MSHQAATAVSTCSLRQVNAKAFMTKARILTTSLHSSKTPFQSERRNQYKSHVDVINIHCVTKYYVLILTTDSWIVFQWKS